MPETVLELLNITRKFYGVSALQDVSLDLRRGEIHALVGENGAGKSTLMKILSGGYSRHEYQGRIIIAGKDVRFYTPLDAERAGIEMIYQELSPHLDLSIAENIFLGRLPTRRFGLVGWRQVYQEAERALMEVGVHLPPSTTLRQLSTSEQQLVAIAKALWRRPKILILDEPTSALTDHEAHNLFDLLVRLKERGLSCIYITHKLDEVLRIADRVTVLRDGRKISTTERAKINADRIVEDMVGRRIETMYPESTVEIGDEVLRVEHMSIPHPYTPHKNIVDDVSFSLRRGEILGLAGLVGAGRSEIAKALFGAIDHDGGSRILLEGRPIQISEPGDAIRAGIALVTEDRKKDGYVGTMDVKQNVSLASLALVSRRSILDLHKERQMAERFSRELSIKSVGVDSSILTLSGGNQQKVVLAKWLTRPLKVLILDEPTRGIDIGAKVQIYRMMSELVQQGVGIITIPFNSSAFEAVYKRAQKAGIPIVNTGVDTPEQWRLAYIGTDATILGQRAAEVLIKKNGGKANICVMMSALDMPNQVESLKAFKDAIKREPGMKLVVVEADSADLTVAVRKFEEVFQAYPQIDTVLMLEATGGVAAARVAKEKGISSKVTILAVDDIAETIDGIRAGLIWGTLAQNFLRMGYESAGMLIDHFSGKHIPSKVDLDVLLITKENVDTYKQAMSEMVKRKKK